MTNYAADPRFEAFNALLPYRPYEDGGRALAVQLEDSPLSAIVTRPHDNTAAPGVGENVVASGSNGNSHRVMDDGTRASLIDVVRKIAEIAGDNYFDMHDSTQASARLQQLDSLLDICTTHIPVDIDRIARFAIRRGDLVLVKHLVEQRRASLTSRDTLGSSPVIYAATFRWPQTLEYVIGTLTDPQIQEEINHQNLSGKTALHYAVTQYSTRHTELCLEHGADPDLEDSSGASVWKLGRTAYDSNMLLIALYRRLRLSLSTPLHLFNFDQGTSEVLLTRQLESPGAAYRDFDLKWLHVPWTNGPLITGALVRILRRWAPKNSENYINFVKRTFEGSRIVPSDKLLSYRPPSCIKLSDLYVTSGEPTYSVVFPCLVIQDMQSFTRSRRIFQALQRNVEWPDVTRYLHTPRTLDEAYYPSLPGAILQDRNKQQVVTRECEKLLDDSDVTEDSKAILMVSQLWIWSFDHHLVVSAFSPPGKIPTRHAEYRPPQDAGPPGAATQGEPISRWERWREENLGIFAQSDDEPCAEDHVAKLIVDQITRFGGTQAGEKYLSPLDYFEFGIIRILTTVHEYTRFDSLDSSINVDKEAELMRDIADIRGELAMIDDILVQQDKVLDSLILHSPCKHPSNGLSGVMPVDRLRTAKQQVQVYRDRVTKIDKDTERIDKAVGDLLNLKRTDASMRDARTSLLLGIAVIGFTVITIIFAPLAFMTALFALDIDELDKHKQGKGDDAVYPSWYVFVTFGAAEVVTLFLTGLFVWFFLRKRRALASWAEGISRKSNATTGNSGRNGNTTATTTPTTTPATTTTTTTTTATPRVNTGAVQGQATAVARGEDTQSTRSSVLSQRRQRPRAADPADAEERGEAVTRR